MAEMITELTQSQLDSIPSFVEEWIKIGLSTEPTDQKAAEEAIRGIYKTAGVDAPNIVWVKSPFEAVKYLVENHEANPGDVLNGVSLWGSHDAYWVANYRFLEGIGVKLTGDVKENFDNIAAITQSCSWVWLYHEIAVAVDRPKAIHLDDSEPRQLHCEDGPAVEYHDGWGVYAIHGVRVPEYVIMRPDEITIEKIKDESNAEVKRIMRERYGEGRYLKDIGAKVIDTDARDVSVADICEGRSVARALVEDDEGNRFLIGTDSTTTRVYYMQVPNTCNTCQEAHEELSGLPEGNIISQS